MFGSQMLEVAIGLVFVYLILSIVVSSVTELISRFFQLRSRNLKNGIDTLLQEDTDQLKLFYDYSLIKSLSREGWFDKIYNQTFGRVGVFGYRQNRPSNIPPATFVQTLFEVNELDKRSENRELRYLRVAKAIANSLPEKYREYLNPTITSVEQLLADGQIDHREALSMLQAAASSIPEESVRRSVLSAIKTAENSDEFEQLYANINLITNQKLQETLTTLVDAADGKIERVQTNVETWFNNTMESCQAWYKRQAQLITLIIACMLPVLMNVDSVLIFNSLSTDDDVRTTVVNAAEGLTTTQEGQQTDVEAVKGDLASLQEQLIGLRLIGWPTFDQQQVDANGEIVSDRRSWPDNNKDRGIRILGWLITAIAASVGAPTWFDLLNKLVYLRSDPKSSSTESPDLGDAEQKPDAVVAITTDS